MRQAVEPAAHRQELALGALLADHHNQAGNSSRAGAGAGAAAGEDSLAVEVDNIARADASAPGPVRMCVVEKGLHGWLVRGSEIREYPLSAEKDRRADVDDSPWASR